MTIKEMEERVCYWQGVTYSSPWKVAKTFAKSKLGSPHVLGGNVQRKALDRIDMITLRPRTRAESEWGRREDKEGRERRKGEGNTSIGARRNMA